MAYCLKKYRYVKIYISRSFYSLYIIHSENVGLPHGAFGVAKLSTSVHAHAASTTSESVSLWSVLAAVAGLAVDLSLVVSERGWLQHLLAQTAGEAHLVEFGTGRQNLLGSVH